MREWFHISEIDKSTYILSEPNHWEKVHSYLLIGKEEALLIDTGLGIGNIKKVVGTLTDLPIRVVTTHVHWDHIGGHDLFSEIYVHVDDAKWLEKGLQIPLEVVKSQVIKEMNKNYLPKGFNIENYRVYKGKPKGLIKDGDIIELGGRKVKAIHTPGHSPGHLCFFEDKTGYLFTGDLIYKGTLYAFYPSTDPVQFMNSVIKLDKIKNVKKIYPGHHDVDIETTMISRVKKALLELCIKDQLKHGSGCHDYGDFQIKL